MDNERRFREQYGLESSFTAALKRWRETEAARSSSAPPKSFGPLSLKRIIQSEARSDEFYRVIRAFDVMDPRFDPPTDEEVLTVVDALGAALAQIEKARVCIEEAEQRQGRRKRQPWYQQPPLEQAEFGDPILSNTGPGVAMRVSNDGMDPIVALLIAQEILGAQLERLNHARPALKLGGKDRREAILDQSVMALLAIGMSSKRVSEVLVRKGFDARIASPKAINARAHRLRKLGFQQPSRKPKSRGRPRAPRPATK